MAFVLLAAVVVFLLMQTSSSISSGQGHPENYPATVVQLAVAIARAEGYYAGGNPLPFRNNNPGDITDSSGALIKYADADTGWDALYDKIMFDLYNGQSGTYSSDMSVQALAQTWTGGDKPAAWASIVSSSLGIDPSSRIGDYLNV